MVRCSADVLDSIALHEISKYADTNLGPLSVTSYSGKPYAEKTHLRVAMVLSAVVEVISKICGHLE